MALTKEERKIKARVVTAARAAAFKRLEADHPDDFARYYNEERIARGLPPLNTTVQSLLSEVDKLKAEIARLKGEER